jgi:hypothetical protein
VRRTVVLLDGAWPVDALSKPAQPNLGGEVEHLDGLGRNPEPPWRQVWMFPACSAPSRKKPKSGLIPAAA